MKPSPRYSELMIRLLSEMEFYGSDDDIPVGALVIDENYQIVSQAFNCRIKNNDPTGHAEIEAIRLAGNKVKNWRLDEFTIIVTLEPCLMCAGAILQSRLKKVVFGASDPKTGGLSSRPNMQINFWPEIIPGVMEKECSILLSNWFSKKRLNQ
jgi:tRNA(adenine34) deaminase